MGSPDSLAPAFPAPVDDALFSPDQFEVPLGQDMYEQGAHVSTSKHKQLLRISVPGQPITAHWEEMFRALKELQGQVKQLQEKQATSTSKAFQFAETAPKSPLPV